MASTSKYIQINTQILVEYIYQDPNTEGVSGGEYETDNTGGNGVRCHVIDNGYTNTGFFFNEDSPQAGVFTGNKRNFSAVPINTDRNKYAWLTTTSALWYGDYDSQITNSSTYLNQLIENPGMNAPTRTVSYDTIRVHLVNGYTSKSLGYDGFIFEAQIKSSDGKYHNLYSTAFLNSSNFETINPTPLLVGEKLYGKYIEIKVPAQTWLENEFYVSPPFDSTKGIAYKLTKASGPTRDGNIYLSIKFIGSTTTTNGQRFFLTGPGTTAVINGTDEFSGLTASIAEATDGDYFTFEGLFEGFNYADYISRLEQNPSTEYIVLHGIKVYEQISQDFTKTSEFSFIQKEDFDKTFAYRPIIQNSNYASAYRIEYELRLYNKADNSQVIKKSSLTNRDVKKYGKKMSRINLGSVPTISKVYNTILDQTGKAISYNNQLNLTLAVPRGDKHIIHDTQFVMGFRESVHILASPSGITGITGNKRTLGGSSKLKFPLGKAPIVITPFDDYIKFIFYIDQQTYLPLDELGSLYLSFKDDGGTEVKIKMDDDVQSVPLDPRSGEVMFKIDKEASAQVLGFGNRQYFISCKKETISTTEIERNDAKSAETMLYYGTWIKPGEKIDDDIIAQAEALAGITEKGQYWKFADGDGTIYWSGDTSSFNKDKSFTIGQGKLWKHRKALGWPKLIDNSKGIYLIISVPGTGKDIVK